MPVVRVGSLVNGTNVWCATTSISVRTVMTQGRRGKGDTPPSTPCRSYSQGWRQVGDGRGRKKEEGETNEYTFNTMCSN